MAAEDSTIIIRNAKFDPFNLQFNLDASVYDLKQELSRSYEGKPQPAEQTLIFSGRVLSDPTAKLRDIVNKHGASGGPYSFHLVVKPGSTATATSSQPAPPTASSSTHLTGAGASSSTTIRSTATSVIQPAAGTASASGAVASPGSTANFLPAAPASTSPQQPVSLPTYSPAYANSIYAGYGRGLPLQVPMGPAAPVTSPGGIPQQPVLPFVYVNPMMAAAYQAAYAAALAATTNYQAGLHQQAMGATAAAAASSASMASAEASLSTSTGNSTAASSATADLGQAGTSGASTSTTIMLQAPPLAAPIIIAPVYVPAMSQSFLTAAAAHPHQYQQVQQQQQGAMSAGAPPPYSVYPGTHVPVANMQFGMGQPGPHAPGMAHPHAHHHHHHPQAHGMHLPHQLAIAQLQVLRQRVQRGAAVAVGAQAAAAAPPAAAVRPVRPAPVRRQRIFHIRLNARMLLQALVFAVVLYQHFTWRRFIMLFGGGLLLYITATWAPLRRVMQAMHAPRPIAPVPAAAPGGEAAPGLGANGMADGVGLAGAAAAGAAGQGNAPGGADAALGAEAAAAPAPAPAAAAVPAVPAGPPRRGVLTEIGLFFAGFLTSLLPAWNYNPDDAAAFALAQDLMAREAREQQAAGLGVDDAGGAIAAVPDAAAEGAGAGNAAFGGAEAGAALEGGGDGAARREDEEPRAAPAHQE